MALSLPSKKTIIADVPEVKNLHAEFVYNFFQPDERTNDSGVPSAKFIQKKSSSEGLDVPFSTTDEFNRFTSRYIRISWSPVFELGKNFSYPSFKIANNIEKLYEEEDFVSDDFTGVVFQDTGLDGKLTHAVNKLLSAGVGSSINQNGSLMDLTKELIKNEDNSEGEISSALLAEILINSNNQGFVFTEGEKLIKNPSLLEGLSSTKFYTQINNKFLTKCLSTLKENSFTAFADEINDLVGQVKEIEQSAKRSSNSSIINSKEYELDIEDYVGYSEINPSTAYDPKFKVLGYYIEKTEISSNGQEIVHEPIIFESAKRDSFVDLRVKYGSVYQYTIRSVAMFETKTFAHDKERGNLSILLRYLVTSKPSPASRVKCIETIPPPPPADFNIRWHGKERAAMLEWNFPVNKQRDIKGFQIFKRNSINEPFELVQVYDFDDSIIKEKDQGSEAPESFLIETLTSPKSYYLDYAFNKDKKCIYAVCSTDARGLSSNYSTQFEVEFDRYKNILKKTLVSLSGAPKAYPNFFLQQDTFVDTIRDSGHNRLRVVFNPEYLRVVDSSQNDLELLKTKDNADYQINVINIDLQEQQNISINLVEQRFSQDIDQENRTENKLLQNRTLSRFKTRLESKAGRFRLRK
jgi:hypothetical protein